MYQDPSKIEVYTGLPEDSQEIKREVNVQVLMEHAEKLINDPELGTLPKLSEYIQEVQVAEKVYELRLELRLKEFDSVSPDNIV